MSSEATERGDRLTTWLVGGSLAVAGVLVVVAIVWSWRLQIVAGGLQLLGIAMTALGVAVVWSLLELAVDKTLQAKRQLDRSLAAGRQRLRLWWLRRRGKTTPAHLAGSSAGVSGGGATLSVGHPSVDRETISERDWLVFLNDQVDILRAELRAAQTRHSQELASRLAAQEDRLRSEMRDELRAATREGWELVLAGLAWLAIGTFLGMWA